MPAKKKVSKKSNVKVSSVKKKLVPEKGTKPVRPKQKQPTSAETKREFPIVGIGTSAGGLDSLVDFFSNMPQDSNMAFIIIQHLDPMRKSNMELYSPEVHKDGGLRNRRWGAYHAKSGILKSPQ